MNFRVVSLAISVLDPDENSSLFSLEEYRDRVIHPGVERIKKCPEQADTPPSHYFVLKYVKLLSDFEE